LLHTRGDNLMNRILITALLASVAFTPALAGKDKDRGDDGNNRGPSKFERQLDRIDEQLQKPGIPDDRSDVLEALKDKFELKLGIVPPPPPPDNPPPQPVKETIFKDDFNRQAIGNGWEGTKSIGSDGEHMVMSSSAGQTTTIQHDFDLKSLPDYET